MGKITIQDILVTFKNNLIRLCDDLVAILPNDADLIAVRLFANALPLVEAIETFAAVTIPYKDKILNKDEDYFIGMANEGNNGMFQDFEKSKVTKFRDIYLSDQLTDQQKNKRS
jgi:hypothetical protein